MSPTALIRSHVLPRYRILLIYLVLQMLLLLRPHLQRTPQVEYCVLRGIFALRHPAAEDAAPAPGRHAAYQVGCARSPGVRFQWQNGWTYIFGQTCHGAGGRDGCSKLSLRRVSETSTCDHLACSSTGLIDKFIWVPEAVKGRVARRISDVDVDAGCVYGAFRLALVGGFDLRQMRTTRSRLSRGSRLGSADLRYKPKQEITDHHDSQLVFKKCTLW